MILMPILNQGEYREASANAPKRLTYYLTLMQMSLENSDMPFPRFLLIDTPETARIDNTNLVKCIEIMEDSLRKSSTPAQVILTTGPDRLPSTLDPKVFLAIDADKHLLTSVGDLSQ